MRQVKEWVQTNEGINFMTLLVEILATPVFCFLSGDAVYSGEPVNAVLLFGMAGWMGVDFLFRLIEMLFPNEGESK